MTVKDLINLNPVPNNYGCVFWKDNISCVLHLYSKQYFNNGYVELKYRLNFATKRIGYEFILDTKIDQIISYEIMIECNWRYPF